MAEAGSGPTRSGTRSDAIGLRLALAFLAVALAAVALLAGLMAAFAAADVSHLASRQRYELASAIAVAAAGAWDRSDSWASADLSPVLDLAASVGADTEIMDWAGRPVASSPGFGRHAAGPRVSAAVVARGQRVGVAVVRFTASGLAGADHALRIALWRAIAGAAGLAALLALLTGLGAARRITRPVRRLIVVARAMGSGDRAARVGLISAPGELRELATAFDQMADTLDRQEQMRRDLVADVAHELRTPIAVLQAGHEALLDGVAEPTAATAADSLAGRFEAAGITLDRRLTPVEVRADPDRLHQVITNLLTNALKFTPSGGRVVIRSGPAGSAAVLQVADTGAGIPASELPRIFDRFWRGRQAAQVSGSGIGLSVAAELARAHGGDLAASSQPGCGTQMTLTLPRA